MALCKQIATLHALGRAKWDREEWSSGGASIIGTHMAMSPANLFSDSLSYSPSISARIIKAPVMGPRHAVRGTDVTLLVEVERPAARHFEPESYPGMNVSGAYICSGL